MHHTKSRWENCSYRKVLYGDYLLWKDGAEKPLAFLTRFGKNWGKWVCYLHGLGGERTVRGIGTTRDKAFEDALNRQ